MANFLIPDSDGWREAWDALRDATGDYSDRNPLSGECWQYMGTFGDDYKFRHRDRPVGLPQIKVKQEPHKDRIYLHMSAESLEVVRVTVRHYDNAPPARAAEVTTGHVLRSTLRATPETRYCHGEDYSGV